MKKKFILIAALLVALTILPIHTTYAQTEKSVVRAVLFYSPTCPHCHDVINGTLTPMMEQYGSQLEIIGVDVTQPQGQQIFLAALEKFKIEQGGVPFLVIDEIYLIGSVDIPEQFPALVEMYLAKGGVDFPNIIGLQDILPAPAESAAESDTDSALDLPRADQLTWQERFAQDRAGNTLAVLVLAAMLGMVGWVTINFKKIKGEALKGNWVWSIPALCIAGFGVAGYLAYVEMFQVAAICGPVGDCNTVQQSEYARLFGVLPVGVLGLAGYIAIFIFWLAARYMAVPQADYASILLFASASFGVLFSIYLTFLEPFVIGATCAWCLTSAILISALMLLSLKPAKRALSTRNANHTKY